MVLEQFIDIRTTVLVGGIRTDDGDGSVSGLHLRAFLFVFFNEVVLVLQEWLLETLRDINSHTLCNHDTLDISFFF